MYRIISITAPLFFFAAVSYAQSLPDILTTAEYKKGVYLSYSEFLRNAPSIQGSFTYDSLSTSKQIEKGKGAYKLIFPDSAVRKRDMRKFWGFCDGKDIFVSEKVSSDKNGTFGILFESVIFRKMQGLGRYCYLMSGYYVTHQTSIGAPIKQLASVDPYVLNINNGEFYRLTKATLGEILEKDPVLFEAFKKNTMIHQDLARLSYIQQYNASHLNEANAELWFNRKVAIFRDQKKEVAAGVELLLNDTLKLSVNPNSVQRLTLEGTKVKICAGENCWDVVLNRKGITYLLVSQKEEKDALVHLVDPSVGEGKIRELDSYGN
jgi:hypothetical protein